MTELSARLTGRAPRQLHWRNGYWPRRWDTRAGELGLRIPKLRQGSFFPSFLEPRRRSEQAGSRSSRRMSVARGGRRIAPRSTEHRASARGVLTSVPQVADLPRVHATTGLTRR